MIEACQIFIESQTYFTVYHYSKPDQPIVGKKIKMCGRPACYWKGWITPASTDIFTWQESSPEPSPLEVPCIITTRVVKEHHELREQVWICQVHKTFLLKLSSLVNCFTWGHHTDQWRSVLKKLDHNQMTLVQFQKGRRKKIHLV